MGRKHCWKRRNCSFSHSVFKKLVSYGRQKVSLCGNGLNIVSMLLVSSHSIGSSYFCKETAETFTLTAIFQPIINQSLVLTTLLEKRVPLTLQKNEKDHITSMLYFPCHLFFLSSAKLPHLSLIHFVSYKNSQFEQVW